MKLKVWDEVSALLEKKDLSAAIIRLEDEIANLEKDPEELCLVLRKLAGLYRLRSEMKISKPEQDQQKACHYAFLAGQAYVQMGRMAPAIALYDWLKLYSPKNAYLQTLKQAIAQVFSMPKTRKPQADDDMPVP